MRAISPVLAVLMMIAIAVAGSLVVYAWAMGYIDLSTEKAEQEIRVQSIANHETDLRVYVQNTGEGVVQLEEAACLYVDGKLVDCKISGVSVSDGVATIDEGKTAILTVVNGAAYPGEKVDVKVTTLPGRSSEYHDYPAGTVAEPSVLEQNASSVLDHFEFDTITSPQTSGVPFTITIRAVDQYGKHFAGYNGVNNLTYSDGTITPTTTDYFLYGICSGEVTVTGAATDATINTFSQFNSSWTGTSNTFNVVDTSVEPHPIVLNKSYGGTGFERAYSLVATCDGGYALAGQTSSFGAGSNDFWLVKTDASGNMEWNRTYGGREIEVARSVVVTSDGGYAITGETSSFTAGLYDVWLVKTNSLGNMEWNKTYGGTESEVVSVLIATSDGGYAILGEIGPPYSGTSDVWFVKIDAFGNMEWNRTYGDPEKIDWACSLVETSYGGYALGCVTAGVGDGIYDFLLIKTDAYGNMEWNRTYGGIETPYSGVFHPCSLIETSDGGFAFTGDVSSSSVEGDEDFWLFKTDEFGNMEWNQTYGGTSSDYVASLVETSDGGYAIAGTTRSFGAGEYDYNCWLVKTDEFGNMEWDQICGGAWADVVYAFVIPDDGGYTMAGVTGSLDDGKFDSNFWLVKIAG